MFVSGTRNKHCSCYHDMFFINHHAMYELCENVNVRPHSSVSNQPMGVKCPSRYMASGAFCLGCYGFVYLQLPLQINRGVITFLEQVVCLFILILKCKKGNVQKFILKCLKCICCACSFLPGFTVCFKYK